MTTARKTVSVAKLLHMANSFMSEPKSDRNQRIAIDTFISNILHETGNYRGFALKDGFDIPIYSAEAPYRHFYFPSGAIADEYDAIASAA
jgi:hypothetical protein